MAVKMNAELMHVLSQTHWACERQEERKQTEEESKQKREGQWGKYSEECTYRLLFYGVHRMHNGLQF